MGGTAMSPERPPGITPGTCRLQLPQCQQQGWVRSSLWTFPHKHTPNFRLERPGELGKLHHGKFSACGRSPTMFC